MTEGLRGHIIQPPTVLERKPQQNSFHDFSKAYWWYTGMQFLILLTSSLKTIYYAMLVVIVIPSNFWYHFQSCHYYHVIYLVTMNFSYLKIYFIVIYKKILIGNLPNPGIKPTSLVS